MVYVYVCKRFKVTMDMVSGKDSEWILNLVKFYLKNRRKEMQKLERAEVNPKKRVTICSYDSSSDIFKVTTIRQETLISSTYCSADKPGLQRPEGERPRVEVDHQSDQVGCERNSEPTIAAREADILAAGQRPGQHGQTEVCWLPGGGEGQPQGSHSHSRVYIRGDRPPS